MTHSSRRRRWGVGGVLTAALIVVCCSGMGPQPVIRLDGALGELDEANRLSYFAEINASDAIEAMGLTGKGVRVTLMGESIDTRHPDLASRVVAQFNTFARRGAVLEGSGGASYGEELLGQNDGHGTHIAGTIAAECDGIGVRGLACGALLDAYDLGAYDNASKFPSEGWEGDAIELRFLTAFATALDHVTQRNESRIVTGSFNLETPAIRLKPSGPLFGKPVAEILSRIEDYVSDPSALFDSGLFTFDEPDERALVERLIEANEGDGTIALLLTLQQAAEWGEVAEAIGRFQASGGLYLVTESNYSFENRSSLLNALPSLSDRVDPDLWLSIVMVERPDDGTSYVGPINTCGHLAADYCLVTPSSAVLSTMTERVAFRYDLPLHELDGRMHQVLGGHSMGAPMVAATLALMQELNEREGFGYSMRDLVRLLKDHANRSFPGFDSELHGRGMLDVSAAIRAMVNERQNGIE